MANILITGGAGFIGSHTAEALVRVGHKVRVLDSLLEQVHGPDAGFPAYIPQEVECVRGDVCDPDSVRDALDGIEAVYHFAALTGVGQSMYEIAGYVQTNCVGTANVLEQVLRAAPRVKRFVLASSRAVYGEGSFSCPLHGPVLPNPREKEALAGGEFGLACPSCGGDLEPLPTAEEHPLNPVSLYGWTKRHQEDLCAYSAQVHRLPVTILRYFNVYGPRQSLSNPYTGIVAIFLSRIRAGRPLSIYERNLPRRDMVHVSDVVRANVSALEADVLPGTAINVGTGQWHSIRSVAEILRDAEGSQVDVVDTEEFRVGDILQCCADLGRARKLLGFEPKVGLQEGLSDFVAWSKGQASEDLYERAVAELRERRLFGVASPTPS